MSDLPTVTIVFLVYNRREELRESLQRMASDSDYPAELVDVIVVDNASEDGVSDMLRQDFPGRAAHPAHGEHGRERLERRARRRDRRVGPLAGR